MKLLTLLTLIGLALAFPDSKTVSSNVITSPIATTPLGQIQGSIINSRHGKPILSFRGIRYAKAPVNELRFKPPMPVEKWDGILNATEDGPVCPQPTTDPVSEDCLMLNVYTTIKLPKGAEVPKRPVVVYIHAGGWYSGTARSTWAGPQYLMDQDIVLVTVNYRLATLGFLSTGDKEATGNYGLKDQVMALKWVQQNIESFGGDKDSVTLMGYSVGGDSVTLHMVSPMSQGLFQRAIAMSGSILGNHPLKTNQLDIAKKQARFVGCPDDIASNIVKCLKTKAATELGESFDKFNEFGSDPLLRWMPVVEEDFGQDRFLPDHPINLVQKGQFAKVPFMTGVTTDEFGWRAFDVVGNATLLKEFNKDWDKKAPIAFIYERNTENSKMISKGIKTFYFGTNPVDNATLSNLAQAYADSLTGFGVNRAAKLIAEKNDKEVYSYRFNYKGRYSHFYLPNSNGTVPYGTVHHDDLIYLFYIKLLFPLFKTTDSESPIVEKMTTLWANFAKTGKPISETSDKLDNAKWEPFTIKTQKYMDIGNKLVMGEKLYEKRYNEWEKLFPLSQYEKFKSAQMG